MATTIVEDFLKENHFSSYPVAYYLNSTNSLGYTPLMLAVMQNRFDIVKALLLPPLRVKINIARVSDGMTPLCIAVASGRIEIVAALVELKDLEVNKACHLGRTALWQAASLGNKELCILLLAQENILKEQADLTGITPYQIAYNKGHFEIAEAIIAPDVIAANNTLPTYHPKGTLVSFNDFRVRQKMVPESSSLLIEEFKNDEEKLDEDYDPSDFNEIMPADEWLLAASLDKGRTIIQAAITAFDDEISIDTIKEEAGKELSIWLEQSKRLILQNVASKIHSDAPGFFGMGPKRAEEQFKERLVGHIMEAMEEYSNTTHDFSMHIKSIGELYQEERISLYQAPSPGIFIAQKIREARLECFAIQQKMMLLQSTIQRSIYWMKKVLDFVKASEIHEDYIASVGLFVSESEEKMEYCNLFIQQHMLAYFNNIIEILNFVKEKSLVVKNNAIVPPESFSAGETLYYTAERQLRDLDEDLANYLNILCLRSSEVELYKFEQYIHKELAEVEVATEHLEPLPFLFTLLGYDLTGMESGLLEKLIKRVLFSIAKNKLEIRDLHFHASLEDELAIKYTEAPVNEVLEAIQEQVEQIKEHGETLDQFWEVFRYRSLNLEREAAILKTQNKEVNTEELEDFIARTEDIKLKKELHRIDLIRISQLLDMTNMDISLLEPIAELDWNEFLKPIEFLDNHKALNARGEYLLSNLLGLIGDYFDQRIELVLQILSECDSLEDFKTLCNDSFMSASKTRRELIEFLPADFEDGEFPMEFMRPTIYGYQNMVNVLSVPFDLSKMLKNEKISMLKEFSPV